MTMRDRITSEDFADDYVLWRRHEEAKNERPGQSAFNMLRRGWPLIANEITGTDIDPFYDDSRLPAFFEWIAENIDRLNEDNDD